MRRFFYVLAAVVLLGLFGVGLGGLHVYSVLQKPLSVDGKAQLLVNTGGSVFSVGRELKSRKILPSALYFRLYARLTKQTQIKAGEYSITDNDTSLSLLKKLNKGDVIVYQLTLVEGWTFKQALAHLHNQEKLQVSLTTDQALQAFLTHLALENNNPEGWFFPDTYRYSSTNSDVDILRLAHQRMQDTLATEWAGRDVGLPFDSPYQALIMASIVEKETGVVAERQQIAGVFVRRLQKNMRLQTDPTVIYGLGENFDGNLRRKHLAEPTPYNTYVIRGLPPTPIALPGRDAIYATLHPDASSNLYFVAKGDGSHYFSETLEEHNEAVKKFQVLRRNKDYRSAPNPESNP